MNATTKQITGIDGKVRTLEIVTYSTEEIDAYRTEAGRTEEKCKQAVYFHCHGKTRRGIIQSRSHLLRTSYGLNGCAGLRVIFYSEEKPHDTQWGRYCFVNA